MSQYTDFIQAVLIDEMDKEDEISSDTPRQSFSSDKEYNEFMDLTAKAHASVVYGKEFTSEDMEKLKRNKYFSLAKSYDQDIKILMTRSSSHS